MIYRVAEVCFLPSHRFVHLVRDLEAKLRGGAILRGVISLNTLCLDPCHDISYDLLTQLLSWLRPISQFYTSTFSFSPITPGFDRPSLLRPISPIFSPFDFLTTFSPGFYHLCFDSPLSPISIFLLSLTWLCPSLAPERSFQAPPVCNPHLSNVNANEAENILIDIIYKIYKVSPFGKCKFDKEVGQLD